ncbi:Ferredoxin-dependent glutamate synthase [Hondaea fermentalgiana]|uniref:Glutamate synthase [NADH] n=1 Tax=Hondaea fermentalgiana TaxID=2315210 RepID=A0A2R5G9R9_9STRA|nr:Ferredoxin-dependent glutamate synthase [Hondaea fermentalgiana]|eukprot:GBG27802.1 Ferredoxin-dependent glutamate synthase [Hondaea fermentalgiana]
MMLGRWQRAAGARRPLRVALVVVDQRAMMGFSSSTTTTTTTSTVKRGSFRQVPKHKMGLYNPALEKDSCGVGMVANLKGRTSHKIVADANEMLARMAHRGGCGCEANTGDGAGILVGMPDSFMRQIAQKDLGIELPAAGNFATGMVFTSVEDDAAAESKRLFEANAPRFGIKVLGWRDVPTNNSMLGMGARLSEPNISQVFVENEAGHDIEVFERELMRMRKATEADTLAAGIEDFYVCSLSARTITYKGQLTPEQLPQYYLDLVNTDFQSHLALVHSRFSTNTFPSWDRAQPNRILCHNGEINTLRGNKNWMHARSGVMKSPLLADNDQNGLLPICSDNMTDSGNVDSVLELLVKGSERSIAEAMMMMIPEAHQNDVHISKEKKAFYDYNSLIMEPWDGPAMMAFTDGRYVGACLDRNGLRPSRFYVTEDDHVILSSEVGVLPSLDPATIRQKGRLEPGKIFLVDFETERIVHDEELKHNIAGARDYKGWLDRNLASLADWSAGSSPAARKPVDERELRARLNAFGYTTETLDLLLAPMAVGGKEALGSMGVDAPLAVLSRLPKGPTEYFKQLFAQVTNPPIDPIREEIVMSLQCPVGPEANLLEVTESHAARLMVKEPILSEQDMAAVLAADSPENAFKGRWFSKAIDITYAAPAPGQSQGDALRAALESISKQAEEAVTQGKVPVIVLSHDNISSDRLPIPSLLAIGAVHQHLIKLKERTNCALFLKAGDAREVHDMACLFGFGADAVCPATAYDALRDLNETGRLYAMNMRKEISDEEAIEKYRKSLSKGLLKVMSKMGISTLQSYKGAQIFEAVGLNSEVVDMCFTGTTTRIEGADFDALAQDVATNHHRAYPHNPKERGGSAGARAHMPLLANPGDYHYRHNGEAHHNSPAAMAEMQYAVREYDQAAWERYRSHTMEANRKVSLRGLLDFNIDPARSISIDEVEPASEILKRFATGAMSLGSISAESHETLAIAMNRLGGRSNTGEGGEDPARFTPMPNGDTKRSAIKQVASGRFGVTAEYIANSDQVQIKMAQGAKPGEGGELPGFKVSEEIAKVRGTTPGVGLISPPPHHDIYSIEDLAQLIHDLKNGNPYGEVSVKLVSEVGVGIVAAGTAKAKADHIVVSGGDGGTGAAAWTGIHRAGLPWELGVAEAQQTLVVNDLRSRVRLQADGQMKTGRDVVISALLGAEECGFSTAPLIALGCIMMRKCHLNTCPVGIATQDPELRRKFVGQPEHVVNFFHFLAEDVRSYMALMGFRTYEEMIGRTDMLKLDTAQLHYKTKGLDLSALLQPAADLNPDAIPYHNMHQDHELETVLDHTLIAKARDSIENRNRSFIESSINNLNRTTGAMLSNQVVRKYGDAGLPDNTIRVKFDGSAGQSFGAFLARGITFEIEGDANDGVGKMLSGGRIIAYPHASTFERQPDFKAEDNIILGNVALYGASYGTLFARGVVGERFCVRNSGAHAVVEGAGDHAMEYMTGGRVAILGPTGRNACAGMSGGIAYVYDPENRFPSRCNQEMVSLESVEQEEHIEELRSLIEEHRRQTASTVARDILNNWESSLKDFVLVFPHDYKRVLMERRERELAAEPAVASA